MRTTRTRRLHSTLAAAAVPLALIATACGSGDSDTTDSTAATSPPAAADTSAEPADATEDTASPATTPGAQTEATDPAPDDPADTTVPATEAEPAADVTSASCDDIAALFSTRGSANADLDDPESSATCNGDSVVITSNGIPDYTYIETSPGSPRANDYTFTIPATPTPADEYTAVPNLGTAAVSLGGIPIYGPTEGTGGDVLSLGGGLSECGSHNGPTGFHIHLVLTSDSTDCIFTPAEVAAEPQLVGYALDGYPIYTGNDQYTSSWELTDESLFASDTWAAHSYVEGLGDLDECNGLTDEAGNYAYYTTSAFPYVIGCYAGVVDLDAAGGGGGGGR